MKKTIKFATLAALAALGVAPANAQSNLVQNLNIQLTGFVQGQDAMGNLLAKPTSISTKDIIQKVLGPALGMTFSTSAKLLVITPLSTNEPVTFKIVVQDGMPAVRTDVSAYFAETEKGDAVETSTVNALGMVRATDYSILEFTLTAAQGDFDVQGVTTVTTASVVRAGKIIGESTQLTAKVAGTGHITGNFAVVQGTIMVVGNKLE